METQKTKQPKEGLHTQGDDLPLKIREHKGEIYIDRNDFYYHGTGIAVIDSTLPEDEQKRVANIIVKAVNERADLLKQLNDEQTLRISGEVALDIIEKQRNELRNERKALLDSHRELKMAAHNALMTLQALRDIDKSIAPQTVKELEIAINNAKNIK